MPLTSTLIAAAPSLLQTIGGGLQSIFGGGRERRAEKALENLKTPTYTPSKAISDYYSTALNRYNTGVYNSPLYQMAKQNALTSEAGALSALNDKRSLLSGIGKLDALTNNSLLGAAGAAEQERNQEFSQLGAAAQQKAQQDAMAYQYNQLAPYEKQLNLLSMKAGGGAQMMNAGLSNIFGGLGNLSSLAADYEDNPNRAASTQPSYQPDYSIPSTYGGYLQASNTFNR